MHQQTLLPEWAEQEAVILAWPHNDTDWAANLSAVRETYLQLIKQINLTHASVVLLCRKSSIATLQQLLPSDAKVIIVAANYNDTWVRDYGFLTVSDNALNYPISFQFNGWGQKFDANLDNQINQLLAQHCQQSLVEHDVVLEGGAIEIDENQHLLSTASCLFNPKRNGQFSASQYDTLFKEVLGARNVSVLNHGHLEGDDTDGHIDTLVRFTPLMGIVVQGADNRTHDEHFGPLFKMQYEVSQIFPQHKIYSLPLPHVVNEYGERLPASYANYLILNRHILMPIYNQVEDADAISVVQSAYPNYTVVPIDCLSVVQQFGSLHCLTMQVPTNTFKTEFLDTCQQGVATL
ncbi:MAG: agmatine deiminase family protein [Glaciecola sp.]